MGLERKAVKNMMDVKRKEFFFYSARRSLLECEICESELVTRLYILKHFDRFLLA
jgi:hypothetical protein